MMRKIQLAPTATLFHADCRDALRAMADCSVDAVVTDPPYELNFMGKGWDNTGIANDPALWAEVFRVLKPGGHLAAFSASRTYHRMACAIEDAGFEIRDSLMWVYGTGFPKSHDVSKGIDKAGGNPLAWQAFAKAYDAAVSSSQYTHADIDRALGIKASSCYWVRTDHRGGMPPRHHWENVRELLNLSSEFERLYDEAEREVVGQKTSGIANKDEGARHTIGAGSSVVVDITAPATDAARQWEGWGTALKPAFEPIVLARKPLSEGTVAANVLRWRTGALNIDGCRVASSSEDKVTMDAKASRNPTGKTAENVAFVAGVCSPSHALGRWPANVVHDGSDEVVGAFPHTKSGQLLSHHKRTGGQNIGTFAIRDRSGEDANFGGDSGSAARFFYSAKASKQDRNGSRHPTVKPISLMEWLCTLITPPGGTILDPFGGSGTTAIAASNKGFPVILCEREAEYIADIRARFGPALPTPDALARFHAWNAKALELQAFLDSRVRQLA